MSADSVRPGAEVDAYCTSCKADRRHRIIAVVGTTPKKVECLSCKGHHLFRQTEAQKAAKAAHKRASKSEVGTTPRLGRSAPATPKRRTEEDLVALWEKAIAGRAFDSFKPYRITIPLAKGDLIRHTKFGEGVVAEVVDANKCEILFKDGVKMLAHSIQA